MRERPVIGILGGMGPEATVDLMRRVIAATPAEDDADHVHLLVDQNPQVPSRIKALIEGTGENPAPVLAAMAQGLERAGARVLAMPCNTAHAYLADIREAVSVPVLDMIELTAERIDGLGLRRVGLLASTAMKITGLYERALASRQITTVYPERQDQVMALIRGVKRGATGAAERAALGAVAEDLRASGCDLVLIACTELSVIADGLAAGGRVLDSIDVLAEAVVAAGLGTSARRAAG